MFADVNLKDAQVKADHLLVGVGGWPTIRYFNNKTGYEGLSYVQKTTEAMCTELGPTNTYMEEFVDAVISGDADSWDREAQRVAQALAKLKATKVLTTFINKGDEVLQKFWIGHNGKKFFQQNLDAGRELQDEGKHADTFMLMTAHACSFTYVADASKAVEATVVITNEDLVCPPPVEVEFVNKCGQTLKKYWIDPVSENPHLQQEMADGAHASDTAKPTHKFEFRTLTDPPCVFTHAVESHGEEHTATVDILPESLECPAEPEEGSSEKEGHTEL